MPARSRRLHPAWTVAAVGFVVLLASAAIRATFGILLEPLMDEFGWSHSDISAAASINLVVFGLAAPFAAALIERVGLRRVVSAALLLIGLSAALITQVTQLWQLYLVWGLMAGAATGAVAPVLAATIAGRWFVARRGLVLGMLTAANSTGQLVFLPLMAHLVHDGWRWTMLVVGGAAAVALVATLAALRDRPAAGEAAYGAEAAEPPPEDPFPPTGRPSAFAVLRDVARDRVFLALAGSFFVCGATTVGLIAVHLIPAAHDHGIPEGRAASLMAAMGVLDIAGTTGSGWLTDRHDPEKLLIGYYVGRGISLLILPAALSMQGGVLTLFTVFYGLDWIATVPPTVAIITRRLGRERGTVAFGWIFAAHQLGGAAAAYAAGAVRDQTGTYDGVFFVSGGLCVAAAMLITLARGPRVPLAEPAAA
ncbi:MFS transporter [Paraconexibacter antarcticus]|uniref:MFS transporter n=1 Tax=Paraconexibacter antarcticus TaxID=2949664 RepID=A0ABY5DUL2_9ACTN|nr:MFS transporter [Paraconexibacter antarcticus]UTI64392.1 MFS transporter [Paraconexibacter antarcticus]